MSSIQANPNRSPLLSPITPSLYGAVPGSIFSALTANPDVNMVNETLAMMKASLGNLDRVFDSLGQQSEHMVHIGGEFETAQLLNRVRKEMDESDHKLEAGINEIKVLLENALQHEIVEHLRSLIEAGVLEQIDEIVKEKVAEELPRMMPKHLQDEVAYHRKQLAEVQRALHNSESRRANSLLRTSKLTENLHTIYKTDGTISPLFPKSLQALFSMDGETAQQLLEAYGMWDGRKSRERNLNGFMQFCGVNYQLVATAGGSRPLKATTPSAVEAINRLV
ncbi:hypothetical protein PHLGIDRAFT_126872 [Phlebiopsis gigantea 11061_1 CR5-6]|uniref:Uncharacterized protein n=1 Tax=Phlebiopsis gigantea (strain 11061_1 CR5-6) TaxID=745531 RepID=A0A0C3S0Y7_PHLG1|nr:hypothetical protein PHLGIDRAFT_126872 [Phlebiopsis gigantea 11061_1 CR5-6]